MAKLYTRKGDTGDTVLFDGTRVKKDDERVETYGLIDELNAHLGLAVSLAERAGGLAPVKTIRDRLTQLQHELFSIGADLATPLESPRREKVSPATAEQASRLESWIDEAAAAAGPLKSFVLPGGDPLACQLHVCRTVCRRAERGVVTLASHARINPQLLIYLNRLSDLLFAWARLINHLAGVSDTPWPAP